ncbi:MAG: hypothetical protein ACI9VR_003171 [Cognaticolwellia sp.]|jgi:hypothetical protein
MRKAIVLLGLFTLSGAALAAASISIDSMEVDGVKMLELQCELSSGGGLMGGMVVASTLASQKVALDACASAGGAYKATWIWTDGKTKVQTVSGLPKSGESCVKKALNQMQSGSTGTCGAGVLVGERTQAEAKWALLRPPAPEAATPPAAEPVPAE